MTKKTHTAEPNGTQTGINLPVEYERIAAICAATEVLIGGRTVIGIADYRDLHAGLEVHRDPTSWIKGRIAKYGFKEGVDYEVIDFVDPQNGGTMESMVYEGAKIPAVARLAVAHPSDGRGLTPGRRVSFHAAAQRGNIP